MGYHNVEESGDGAGGKMLREDMDLLWSECILIPDAGPDDPIALIPAWQKSKGRSCSNTLKQDGYVCRELVDASGDRLSDN